MDAITRLSISILAEGIVSNVNRIRALRRPPTHKAESLLSHIEAEARLIRDRVSQKAPPRATAPGEANTAPADRREASH